MVFRELMGSYYVYVAFQLIYQLSYIWMLILLAKHFKNVDALLQKLLWTQVVVNCLVTANGHLPREHIFFQDRLFTQFFQFIYLFQVLLTIIGATWLICTSYRACASFRYCYDCFRRITNLHKYFCYAYLSQQYDLYQYRYQSIAIENAILYHY